MIRHIGELFSFYFGGPPTEANPGNSHQSLSDPGLVRVRPALGHYFAYDTVRSEQHGGFKLPFSWDEGDGTGEPRLLAGSSEASKASTSVEQNHKGCTLRVQL